MGLYGLKTFQDSPLAEEIPQGCILSLWSASEPRLILAHSCPFQQWVQHLLLPILGLLRCFENLVNPMQKFSPGVQSKKPGDSHQAVGKGSPGVNVLPSLLQKEISRGLAAHFLGRSQQHS